MRVPYFLSDHCVAYETITHPPAFTAAKRARRLHVPGRNLAKCVLLAGPGPGKHVLAILPATHYVDLDIVSAALMGSVRLARDEEIPEIFRDCEWGAIVPFGTLYGVPSLLEDSFGPDSLLVFECQMHAIAIRMRCYDFERLEKPKRLTFARRGFKPENRSPESEANPNSEIGTPNQMLLSKFECRTPNSNKSSSLE
jgi:Ala-tRNA(Pro) deacylase